MALCPHSQWMDLSGLPNSREWSITYGQRLHTVLNDLPSPDTKFPTVFFFLGKRSKVLALRDIFPNNNITRRKAHGIAGLHLDTTTASSPYPLLFADCNPDAEYVNLIGRWDSCHENVRYRVNFGDGAAATSTELVDKIHAQLLLSFVDVVCFFADDLGGEESVADRLMRWIQCRGGSHCIPVHKPGVVVVATGSQAYHTLSLMEKSPGFCETFASLTVVDTTVSSGSSALANQMSLRGILTHEANKVRDCRSQLRVLYSATHMKAFFLEALKDFTVSPERGFDFVAASRRRRRHPQDFVPHLEQFLSLATREHISEASIASFAASALLMDCYPAGMHCTRVACAELVFDANQLTVFLPDMMFDRYYAAQCLEAAHDLPSVSAAMLQVNVKRNFTTFFTDLENGKPSRLIRYEDMVSIAPQLNILKTTQTCLFCVRICPEHLLPCGHSICDTCVSRFGKSLFGMPHRFQLSKCLICLDEIDFVAWEELATINPCILSIDGGGIKGIVALEFLGALQEALGPDIPLQVYFDLVVATSSGSSASYGKIRLSYSNVLGAIIALDLFTNGSSIKSSTLKFTNLAQRVFPRSGLHSTSFCVRTLAVLRSLFRDRRYNASDLEEVVKEEFGTTRRLFGASTSGPLGAKIAIMAAETSESVLCILTNYNKTAQRRTEAGELIILIKCLELSF
jgi:hypothetical protein